MLLLNAAPDHPFFCHDHIHALVIRLRRELMKDLELVCQGNGLMTGMRLQIPVIISAAFSKADAVLRKSHARQQDRCCRKNIPGFLMKYLVQLFRSYFLSEIIL